MGVGEETLGKEPLVWWWPLYGRALFDSVGLETTGLCLESLAIQCFPSVFQSCSSSSLGLLFCPSYSSHPLTCSWIH